MKMVLVDTSLQDKLKAAGDADAVVAIAKTAGFVITAEELKSSRLGQELSEEELEGVAGGTWSCAGDLPVCGISG